jgi:hypothetical protein
VREVCESAGEVEIAARCFYIVVSWMLTWPGGVGLSLLAMGEVECTGPSTVDVFVLGIELLWGDCAVLDRAGVEGTSAISSAVAGESIRSYRYIFFSTCGMISSDRNGQTS